MLLNFIKVSNQINDHFSAELLEAGSFDLIDINDYHNLKLVVTTAKNIYLGIPPALKSTTGAKLINVSSIITLNENYLLAACLEDSLLTKININSGAFLNLLDYSQIDSGLEVPISSCSLSILENTIFIGYTQIDYYDSETNKTNMVFKFNISDKDSSSGPIIAEPFQSNIFIFPKSFIKTNSSRQISCEPLRISNELESYRLICLFEIYDYYSYTHQFDFLVYATSINENFDNFENKINEIQIYYFLENSGFKIYKLNETHARCLMKKAVFDISISKKTTGYKIVKAKTNPNLYAFTANVDLFDYNNNFVFSAINTNFMNNENIISFRINKETSSNYFKLYNYKENDIRKILCYYKEENDYFLFLYQTPTNIKYFTLKDNHNIYNIDYFSDIIEMKSYQKIEYDINDKLNNIVSYGNLIIESIIRNNSGSIISEKYGIDFYELLIENGLLIPYRSLNDRYDYSFAFIDNVVNEYTRMYYLNNVFINVSTCFSEDCISCWENYYQCDNCESGVYALLIDNNNACYPTSQFIKGYIYDDSSKVFKKCYSSCEFCSSSSEDITDQRCESCPEGYLYSFGHLGNCFNLNNIPLIEDKILDNTNNENYISTTCSKYKIYSTGECVEECPTSSPFYSYEYDSLIEKYIKNSNLTPPKYLFNNVCYETCDINANTIADEENNICKCQYAFHIQDGEFLCYSDFFCISDYPYKNQDTNQCYSTLEECNYFFNNNCYEYQCPSGKINLSTKSEIIKNYYMSKLSLNINLINKICICDTTNGVWSNLNSNELYYQECLTECPEGYEPEEITKYCIEKQQSTATEKEEEVEEEKRLKIDGENENNCPTRYKNKCYLHCPENTCLSQDDPELTNCTPILPYTKIFNDICFNNLEIFTNNIKAISDNNEIISIESGIIIHGYSTKNINDNLENDDHYSIVYLGDCETKLREYYNLSESIELFILGIDSPNKNKSFITTVYNYGVYLENGTQLDHSIVCKDSKISISSPILNPELVKLEEANYFSNLGYDIYNENSTFYTDNCAPASINGNDITLADRKKDFFPSNISLCNESCYYTKVNFTSKRFSCECDINYNYSSNNIFVENIYKEDISYVEYFLSLINYKITVCYKLFFDFKSYYYNAGFYIAVGALLFSICQIFIFNKLGMKGINKQISDNIPDISKLKETIKNKNEKRIEVQCQIYSIQNNPPNKKIFKENNFTDSKKSLTKANSPEKVENHQEIKQNQEQEEKEENDIQIKKNSNKTKKTRKSIVLVKKKRKRKNIKKGITKINRNTSNEKLEINNTINVMESMDYKNINKNEIVERIQTKNNANELVAYIDDEVDKKELNNVPFTQALRIDKRNYAQIFLSVLAHEIQIIEIFYYKNVYTHLSITLSIYVFELCLDLTLNCILYTDDVVSEKYNNNGSIGFFTSLSLSFMSNIIASIIAFIVAKLANYADVFEYIIKDAVKKSNYFLNMNKFKKYLVLKLSSFFIIQIIINLCMCYYLMIFCTVYHKTQGSIMINYIIGISESMAISLGLSIITSLMRLLSIKYKWKSIYYTSKYFFENF